MRLFSSLAIELTSSCNRKCSFCPVAYNERPDERMSNDIRLKIFNELAELKYHGRIALHLYNEPTRDFDFLVANISTLRHHVPNATLMISTMETTFEELKEYISCSKQD